MENKDQVIKFKATTTQDEESMPAANSSIFSDQIPTTPISEIKTSSLGFIDNSIQDYMMNISNSNKYSLFDDMFQTPPPEVASPSTGNNSISSISSTGEEQDKDQEEETKSTSNMIIINKHELIIKPTKKNTKRQTRQARFAFMTKSDVDHLDDGYRWRKYGQKAVKNSPYPRSYYRCTMASCGVKKRVERSSDDSTIVVTTYEGNHGHPCPVTLRGTTTTEVPAAASSLGGGGRVNFQAASPNFINISQPHNIIVINPPSLPHEPFSNNNNPNFLISDLVPHEYYNNSCTPFSSSSNSSMVRDHGLLQDMIMPSQARKESEDQDVLDRSAAYN